MASVIKAILGLRKFWKIFPRSNQYWNFQNLSLLVTIIFKPQKWECNTRECAYDNGECVEKNIENGLDLDPDKEYMPDFSGRDSNHKAKLAYANYKLTTKFGGVRRPNHPHIPIMINRDIFDGKSCLIENYNFNNKYLINIIF